MLIAEGTVSNLFPFVHSSYGSRSFLCFGGDRTMISAEGVQEDLLFIAVLFVYPPYDYKVGGKI